MKILLANLLLLIIPACVAGQGAKRYDIIIDELMVDPTPVQGLPNAEFAELRNVSNQAVNLKNWRFGTTHASAIINADVWLKPDSFVVVCANNAVMSFSFFGNTVALSNFPSLDNDGDLVFLQSPEGEIIHALHYQVSWYHNAVKQLGGWSLEMIDVHFPCAGIDNWKASGDPSGGTPGKLNSVSAAQADAGQPKILRSYVADSSTVVIHFSKPLDSVTAVEKSHYEILPAATVDMIAAPGPLFDEIHIQLNEILSGTQQYELRMHDLQDCTGNVFSAATVISPFAEPDSMDLVINEILFDPPPNGSDYLELYNRSAKTVNLSSFYVGNRNGRGELSSLKRVSEESVALLPGGYLVLTEDTLAILRNYLVTHPENLMQLTALPSWPNDKGTVVLLDKSGRIVDELAYDEKWQFPLLASAEGVALERINVEQPTQDPLNWHSAASQAGYGTPGYKNSSARSDVVTGEGISVRPSIFSPDGDGVDDFAEIYYQFPEPGNVCSVTIFDSNGRLVRRVVKNAVCGIQGSFKWDGLGETQQVLPMGPYVVFTQVFNLQGKVRSFKKVITLARRK